MDTRWLLLSCLIISVLITFLYYQSKLDFLRLQNNSHESYTNISERLQRYSGKNNLGVNNFSSEVKDKSANHPTLTSNANLINIVNKSKSFTNYTINGKRRTSKIMRFYGTSCEPIYPEVLLYNRIFKTGSTTIASYVKNVTLNTNITVKSGTTEDWYKTGDPRPYPNHIEKYGAKKERLIYSAHFFFRSDMKIKRPYTYINVFREPVDRVISHYKYMRNEKLRFKKRILELKASGQWNETLKECVLRQHRGCEDNVMTRFICGTHEFCKTGSQKALERAKSNLKKFYSCIGTLQNINTFVQVLHKRLPTFFTHSFNGQLSKQKQNKIEYKVNEKVLQMIIDRNKSDAELYKFVQLLEEKQYHACGF